MTDVPTEMEGIPIVIELEGVSEAAADDLRKLFDADDEDVVFSHAFGGIDTVAIITSLGKATIGKLIDYFARSKTNAGKTKLKLGKNTLEMDGFSRQDIEALLASENFQKTVRSVRGK
jgi:hypothetical protein